MVFIVQSPSRATWSSFGIASAISFEWFTQLNHNFVLFGPELAKSRHRCSKISVSYSHSMLLVSFFLKTIKFMAPVGIRATQTSSGSGIPISGSSSSSRGGSDLGGGSPNPGGSSRHVCMSLGSVAV